MATTESNDIVDRTGTAFIRFNDDGRHPRAHPVRYAVYEVRIERRHHRIATKSRGGADGRPDRYARCTSQQSDQSAGGGTHSRPDKRTVAIFDQRHVSAIVFFDYNPGLQLEFGKTRVFQIFDGAGSVIGRIGIFESRYDEPVSHFLHILKLKWLRLPAHSWQLWHDV